MFHMIRLIRRLQGVRSGHTISFRVNKRSQTTNLCSRPDHDSISFFQCVDELCTRDFIGIRSRACVPKNLVRLPVGRNGVHANPEHTIAWYGVDNFQPCCSNSSARSDGLLQHVLSATRGLDGHLDFPSSPVETMGRRMVASNQVLGTPALAVEDLCSWLTIKNLMANIFAGTECDRRYSFVAGAADVAWTVNTREL